MQKTAHHEHMRACLKLSAALAISTLLAACSGEPTAAEDDAPASPPREFVLPASVVPVSDTLPHFGIDLAALDEREAAVVASAWADYQRVLAGGELDCPVSFGVSDGGSLMFDCGSYTLFRVKSLAGTRENPGYEYGPSLDFLNGHEIERLRFMSYAELERLERSGAPSSDPASPAE
jgi:hypothetical protein